jgi:hypothetical protein
MPDRKVFEDYDEDDVQAMFELARPTTWPGFIHYLRDEGVKTWHIVPGQSAHMIADARQAMIDNVPFPHSSETAFRVMRSHRNPELVRHEEQYWLEQVQASEKGREIHGGHQRHA